MTSITNEQHTLMLMELLKATEVILMEKNKYIIVEPFVHATTLKHALCSKENRNLKKNMFIRLVL